MTLKAFRAAAVFVFRSGRGVKIGIFGSLILVMGGNCGNQARLQSPLR